MLNYTCEIDGEIESPANYVKPVHPNRVCSKPFCSKYPIAWFQEAEKTMITTGIHSYENMYKYIIKKLPPQYVKATDGRVSKLPDILKYNVLKVDLLRHLKKTKTTYIMRNEFMEGRTPSSFLHHLYKMTNDTINGEDVWAIWLMRLPPPVSAALLPLRRKLTGKILLIVADSMYSIYREALNIDRVKADYGNSDPNNNNDGSRNNEGERGNEDEMDNGDHRDDEECKFIDSEDPEDTNDEDEHPPFTNYCEIIVLFIFLITISFMIIFMVFFNKPPVTV